MRTNESLKPKLQRSNPWRPGMEIKLYRNAEKLVEDKDISVKYGFRSSKMISIFSPHLKEIIMSFSNSPPKVFYPNFKPILVRIHFLVLSNIFAGRSRTGSSTSIPSTLTMSTSLTCTAEAFTKMPLATGGDASLFLSHKG